ncbi:hypothetical protein V3C99_015712 [Haemonchus contortus]
MMDDLTLELCRRKRAAWRAFENIEGSEEDKEHPAPRSPFRHCCPSCFDNGCQRDGQVPSQNL